LHQSESLFLFYAVLSLCCVVSALSLYRRLSLCARLCILALGTVSLALLLGISREEIGHDVGVTLASGIQFLAYMLLLVALLAFESSERNWRLVSLGVLGALSVHLLISTALARVGAEVLQTAFITLCFSGAGVLSGVVSGRIASAGYRAAVVLGFLCYAIGGVWALRLVPIVLGHGPEPLDEGWNLATHSVLFILSIVRWFALVGLEFERMLNRAEHDAEEIRQQAAELAQRNAALAQAMLAVPVPCIVTDRSSRILLLNDEAKRLLHDDDGRTTQGRQLSRLFIGLDAKIDLADGVCHDLFLRPFGSGLARFVHVKSQSVGALAESTQRVMVVRPSVQDAARIAQAVREIPLAPQRLLMACELGGDVLASALWLEGYDERLRDALSSVGNVWTELERHVVADRATERALARVRLGQTGSALFRTRDGLFFDLMACRIETTERGRALILVEVKVLRKTQPVRQSQSEGRGRPGLTRPQAVLPVIPEGLRRSPETGD
jgi:PAS domain-containing protein